MSNSYVITTLAGNVLTSVNTFEDAMYFCVKHKFSVNIARSKRHCATYSPALGLVIK